LKELGGDGGRVEPFGFVDRDDHALAHLAERLRDVVIVRGRAIASVDEEQHAIGLFDGSQCLPRHDLFDALRVHDQAAGIHDQIGNHPDLAVTVITIARQPRQVRDQRIASAREKVEQRRLADVGATDQRNNRQHKRAVTCD
jgi:hypothetical protein